MSKNYANYQNYYKNQKTKPFQMSYYNGRIMVQKMSKKDSTKSNILKKSVLNKFENLENKLLDYLSEFVKYTESCKLTPPKPVPSGKKGSRVPGTPRSSSPSSHRPSTPKRRAPSPAPNKIEEKPAHQELPMMKIFPTNLEKKIVEIERKTKNIQKYNKILEANFKKNQVDNDAKTIIVLDPRLKETIFSEVKKLEEILIEKRLEDRSMSLKEVPEYEHCQTMLQECIDMLGEAIKEEKAETNKIEKEKKIKQKDELIKARQKDEELIKRQKQDELIKRQKQEELIKASQKEQEFKKAKQKQEELKKMNRSIKPSPKKTDIVVGRNQEISDDEFFDQYNLDINDEEGNEGDNEEPDFDNEESTEPKDEEGEKFKEENDEYDEQERQEEEDTVGPLNAIGGVRFGNIDFKPDEEVKYIEPDRRKLFQIQEELGVLEYNNKKFLNVVRGLKKNIKYKNEDDLYFEEFVDEVNQIKEVTHNFEVSENHVEKLIGNLKQNTYYF